MKKLERGSRFSAATTRHADTPTNSGNLHAAHTEQRSTVRVEASDGYAVGKVDEPEIILLNIDRFNSLLKADLDEVTREMVRKLRDEFATSLLQLRR